MALTDYLSEIANAIRVKDGTEGAIVAANFPERILAIPSGGIDLPSNMKTGVFYLDEDTVEPFKITHNLGQKPWSIILCVDEVNKPKGFTTIGGIYFVNGNVKHSLIFTFNGGLSYGYGTDVFTDITETEMTLNPRADTYPYRTGYTYRWIMWGAS